MNVVVETSQELVNPMVTSTEKERKVWLWLWLWLLAGSLLPE